MMKIIPIPFIRRRSARTGAAAPAVVNQILHVRKTVDPDAFVVQLNQPLVTALSDTQMLEISEDGVTWFAPYHVSYDTDPLNITFSFNDALPDAAFWRVPVATDWVFADSATLDAPYAGDVEEM